MKRQEQRTNYAVQGPTQALATVSVVDRKGAALPPPTTTPPYRVLPPPSNHNGSGVHAVVYAPNGAATGNVVTTPEQLIRRPRSYATVEPSEPPKPAWRMILLGLLFLLVIFGGIAALVILSRLQH